MEQALYRSKKNRFLAGVCGGLGEYFKIDPAIIRLIFVVFTFTGGAGVLAYIIFWILEPEQNGKSYADSIRKEFSERKHHEHNQQKTTKVASRVSEKRGDAAIFVGSILIIIGLIFLASNFFPLISLAKLWPLILVVIGLGLLLSSIERR